jgi:hypothetical protein
LYLVQRSPSSLGAFRWRIDQKNSEKPVFEQAFARVAPPFLQSLSLQAPMPMMEGADYSYFSRFDMERPAYLERTYGIKPQNPGPVSNIGRILRENLQFVDSNESDGVQVADLLAAGIRRCLRGEFPDNELVAAHLGSIMVQPMRGEPAIQLLGFGAAGGPLPREVGQRIVIMRDRCRPMLI